MQNDYPIRLINRLMNRYHQRNTSSHSTGNTDETTRAVIKRFSFPYVPAVSRSIARAVTEKCDNVVFAYKNNSNVGKLYSKLKDPIPIKQATNVVYRINCADGDGKCYIGTSDDLKRRLAQHANDIAKNRPEKSALAHHAITNSHTFDFDNVKVLEREKRYRKRMLLEEFHIKSCRNCVNFKSIDTRNVNDIYTPLLRKISN